MNDKNKKTHKIIDVAIESGEKTIWVPLPTTPNLFKDALIRIDALDKEFTIVDCRTPLDINFRRWIVDANIDEVNYLANRLSGLPKFELEKLEAVAENSKNFPTLSKMIDFTYNIACYEFLPKLEFDKELAEYYIYKSGFVKMPNDWKNGIDLNRFGKNIEECQNGVYTRKGYLFPTNHQWEKVFEKTNEVPPQFCVYNNLESAEISIEQNYNQIDGTINNLQNESDLTDEDYEEFAKIFNSEISAKPKKDSILGQLKEAKENTKPSTPTDEKISHHEHEL